MSLYNLKILTDEVLEHLNSAPDVEARVTMAGRVSANIDVDAGGGQFVVIVVELPSREDV